MSFAFTRTAGGLTVGNPICKSILLHLAGMADDSGFCFPSITTIAERLELGESTVRKWLKVLEEKQLIKKTRLPGNKWKQNGYQMNFSPDFSRKLSLPDKPDNADKQYRLAASQLPESGDNNELPLFDSGDSQQNNPSPLRGSNITATKYHRYDVAPNLNNKEELESSEETLNIKNNIVADTTRNAEKYISIANFDQPHKRSSLTESTKSKPVNLAERLFRLWQKTMEDKRSIFSDKRKIMVTRVMKKKSYAECLRAIRGCYRSDFHMARDPEKNATKYNEFERIFKSIEETEKFIRRYYEWLSNQQTQQPLAATQQNRKGERNEKTISNQSGFIDSKQARIEANRQREDETLRRFGFI